MDEEWARYYADISAAIELPGFVEKLHETRPSHNSLIRDTCSITRMRGSSKINVVPPTAWAELDCRILPDKPPEQFINELSELIRANIPSVTLGLTTGQHKNEYNETIDIEPTFDGLAQLIALMNSIDGGICDA